MTVERRQLTKLPLEVRQVAGGYGADLLSACK